jgi:CubicO group peptidase (beta-lactamase class C family)
MRSLWCLLLCWSIFAQESFGDLDSIMTRYFEGNKPPGLIYGVVQNGRLVKVNALGVQDLKTKRPVTANSAFRIASMSKSFTAAAILLLRDEGKLQLDDAVTKYVPEFGMVALPTRDAAPITIRQLLTHGTGLPEDNPWGDRQLGQPNDQLRAWLRKGLPFSTAPDTEFEYSNFGFALAGQVIEVVSGKSYREFMETRILKPLQMNDSYWEPSEVPLAQQVQGYGKREGALIEIASLPHGSFGAMGGLVTTANDLAKWVAFQLSAWPARDGDEAGPIKRSSLREMQRVWRTASFGTQRATVSDALAVRTSGYGYGLGVTRDCRFDHLVGHGGGLPGFGSHMLWLPEYGIGLFAMANLTYAGPSRALMQALHSMAERDLIKRMEEPASAILEKRKEELFSLFQTFDEVKFREIAADNLSLDVPNAMRAKDWAKLKSELGDCQLPSPMKAENKLRGSFQSVCAKGILRVSFTLAPTAPPLVQELNADGIFPAGKRLRQTATKFLKSWEPRLGKCQLGDAVAGDGVESSELAVSCDRDKALVAVTKSGEARLLPAAGGRCVP